MADVSSRQLRKLLFEPAKCQFNGKLMRILQHSQVLVSLFFDSSCIDMRMPARSAVHNSRPLCPKRLDTSSNIYIYILGLSSIPVVSMDRWRSPSDNRYARNAGVSIRYKK